MKINIKITVIIIIALMASWLGNIYFFCKNDLKRPLILKTYSNIFISETSDITFIYATNVYDKDNICTVSFPELNTEPVYVNAAPVQNIKHSNYKLNRVLVRLGDVFLKGGMRFVDTAKDGVSFTKVIVTTLSNKNYEFNLGKVCFSKWVNIADNSIGGLNCSSTNNVEGSSSGTVNTDFTINEVNSNCKDLLLKLYDIQLNDISFDNLPKSISYKAGDQIKVSYRLKDESRMDLRNKFSNIHALITLKGINKEGKYVIMDVYIDRDSYWHLTGDDVRKLVKEGT